MSEREPENLPEDQELAPGATGRSRRVISTALAVAVLGAGVGGAFAIAGGGPPSPPTKSASSNGKSAANKQYKPGKGCGDKNHVHEREDECKKPPKGGPPQGNPGPPQGKPPKGGPPAGKPGPPADKGKPGKGKPSNK